MLLLAESVGIGAVRRIDRLVETVVSPGAVWRNEPGTIHTIEALEDAVVLEVSTPELDDVVRLDDRYGRR